MSMTSPSAVRTDIVERLDDLLHKESCFDKVTALEAAEEITRLRSERDEMARAIARLEAHQPLTPDIDPKQLTYSILNATIVRLDGENATLRSANSLLIAVVQVARSYEPLFVSPEGETREEWAVRALMFIRRLMYALWDCDKALAALSVSPTQKEEQK